ncbi:MAG: hypothetical protein ABL936_23415, partial [Aestuariivirga sp.]
TCDACHVTAQWVPAVRFDHLLGSGTCVSCHSGSRPPAVGKSPSHFITSQACESCHTSTTAWTQVGNYTHLSAFYEPHRAGVTCLDCHTGTPPNEKISFPFVGGPDCAGCHANEFEPDPHTKYGNTKYTVLELKDCSGACHTYSDATMTTIRNRRAGPEHKGTGSF